MDVCTGVRWVFVWAIDRLIDCMGVCTGNRVDVCRAIRRAVIEAIVRRLIVWAVIRPIAEPS